MKHLVFDINVILDVLLHREGAETADKLFELIAAGTVQGWVAASSLPIIEYLVQKELKTSGAASTTAHHLTTQLMNWTCQYLKPLSVPGQESLELCGKAKDFEDAQITLAALALGDSTIIAATPALRRLF